jgi:DNA-directed RNA polymerase specialized sigma24 family protein
MAERTMPPHDARQSSDPSAYHARADVPFPLPVDMLVPLLCLHVREQAGRKHPYDEVEEMVSGITLSVVAQREKDPTYLGRAEEVPAFVKTAVYNRRLNLAETKKVQLKHKVALKNDMKVYKRGETYPNASAERDRVAAGFEAAIEEVDPLEREALLLFKEDKYTHAQIAVEQSCSIATVKRRIMAGAIALAAALERNGLDDMLAARVYNTAGVPRTSQHGRGT